jgi:hypothetical protein
MMISTLAHPAAAFSRGYVTSKSFCRAYVSEVELQARVSIDASLQTASSLPPPQLPPSVALLVQTATTVVELQAAAELLVVPGDEKFHWQHQVRLTFNWACQKVDNSSSLTNRTPIGNDFTIGAPPAEAPGSRSSALS